MEDFKKYAKKYWVYAALIVIAIILYVKRDKLKEMLGIGKPTTDTDKGSQTPTPAPASGGIGTLKRGSKGIDVRTLQAALNAELKFRQNSAHETISFHTTPTNPWKDAVELKVDGDFGTKTEIRLQALAGVKEIQLSQLQATLISRRAKASTTTPQFIFPNPSTTSTTSTLSSGVAAAPLWSPMSTDSPTI